MNNPLIVKHQDLQIIKHWPLELRAIFDPSAQLELAQRIERERQETEARHKKLHSELDEIPF